MRPRFIPAALALTDFAALPVHTVIPEGIFFHKLIVVASTLTTALMAVDPLTAIFVVHLPLRRASNQAH